MASNFEFYSPTRVIFGKGTEQRVGALVREYGGTRVLIVYGGKSAVRSGVLDRAEKSLAEAGISSWTLGGVVPNPHLDKVYEGIRIGKENSIDFLLAVGGGSVIDTAKAIAYGLAEPEKDVWELYEHTRTARKCLPVASILTIAAAGSETSNSSVITRVDTHQKRAYNDDISRPKFALMDPELTKTLPDYQTESGCADIMMHTMERYFTNGGNMELTDALAEGLLRTVMKNALILHTDPANYEARAEVMWAGSLSHNGLTGCGIASGDFMSHKLEHEMGGMFDVTHGAGLAALWPSWARYVYKDCLPRFVRFARNVMGVTTDGTDEEIALKGIDAMVDFYHRRADRRDGPPLPRSLRLRPRLGQKTQPRRHDRHLPRRQPLRKLFPFRPAQDILLTLCRAFRCRLCASSHFLAKKWKRDGKNKSICLNSKYKRSAPLLHTEAEGVRFSMSAESFQQHKTSFSYHKFPSPFWEELSAKQTERAIHPYKE